MKGVNFTAYQKRRALKLWLEEKLEIEKVCQKCKCRERSLWRWKAQYDGTLESLEPKFSRKHIHHPNEQTDEEKVKVMAVGGLYILGTERHESRRIDNQLRGRSGRQGDPGNSIFFISLEDDLAKRFGGEKMQRIYDMFNIDENQPMQAKMLSNSIENAQRNRLRWYNDWSRCAWKSLDF